MPFQVNHLQIIHMKWQGLSSSKILKKSILEYYNHINFSEKIKWQALFSLKNTNKYFRMIQKNTFIFLRKLELVFVKHKCPQLPDSNTA